MATIPYASSAVSVPEYPSNGYEAAWDYEGDPVSRRQGNALHARMVTLLASVLNNHDDWIRTYTGLLLFSAESRYRVPDVCCYLKSTKLHPDRLTTEPPVAVFEVLSKGDQIHELRQKCAEYKRLGILRVFLIDAYGEIVLVPSEGGFPAVSDAIEFAAGDHNVRIALDALFARLKD